MENQFPSRTCATIGVDFRIKTIQISDKTIKLQIWDTSGNEIHRSMDKVYLRNASGIIYCYSCTEKYSFDQLEYFISDTHQCPINNVAEIISCDKIDLSSNRKTSTKEGRAFASKNSMEYIECSAKTGENIDFLFEEMIRLVLEKNPNLFEPQISSTLQNSPKKKNGCKPQ
jgi:small GTP-binding protein